MPRRLMCVVAHPDDECFAFGGALLLAKEANWEVLVVCMTDGQAATNRGHSVDASELGRMRRDEFRRSCAVLGVDQFELLEYQDGTLEFQGLHDAARELVRRMRRWQPHTVLTFGLDGSLNLHPDHTATSAFTSAAFHWSARSKRFPELGLPAHAPERLFHQSTDFVLPDREPLLPSPWTVELDIRHLRAQKEAAFREHTSQLPVLDKIQPFWDRFGNKEFYVLAASNTPRPAEVSTAMFAKD